MSEPESPATPSEPSSGEVTRLLARASNGDRSAVDALFPLVYDELREIGRSRLRREADGHTLNATALVHETYVRLVDQDRVEWRNRAHFLAVSSLCMRRILVSHARDRLRQKRGGGAPHLSLEDLDGLPGAVISVDEATELVALDRALEELRAFNPQGAEVVQYRFFGGLEHREISEVAGVSEVTVRRRWTAARAWLRDRLGDDTLDRNSTLLAG